MFDLLDRLLTDGDAVLVSRPVVDDRPRLMAGLRAAFDAHALGVAGPPLAFDASAALAAAECLASACWFAVSLTEPAEEVERAIAMPDPRTPSEHLSADVCLRLLPAILRRARARAADDPLAVRLTDLLRRWPLSGVLTDIHDAPRVTPDFAGHYGLRLLYAERLATNDRPAWRPTDGGLCALVSGSGR